jgi:phage terminase small subunit
VSVIDELKGLEDRVAQRMSELRPLVDEYRELEQVAQRLGVTPSVAADVAADAPRRPRRTRRRAAPAASANGGAADGRRNGRREQLLAAVKARPGITVREVGTELGVDPTSRYRIVHQLEQDGALQKRGRELLPR